MKKVLVDETDHFSIIGIALIAVIIILLVVLIVPLAILFIGDR